nr:hypothetical protein BaRGS_018236 [Batillaria attramentaria]
MGFGQVDKRLGAIRGAVILEEASKLNTSLMHANRHQQCVIDQLRKDTDKLRSQLVKARAALQREPPDTIRLTEQQEEIHRLKLRLETMEARNKTTEREFQTCETSYQMCMKNLKNAQALINRHLTDREKYEGKIELLEAREQDLKRQCETLNTQLETAYSELEELGKRHDDDVKRWTEKVDRANTEIADLKEELSATTSVLKSKEDQNHSLSDQLQHTADQLSKAQTDEVREVKIPDMMGNTASKRACSGDHSASGIATEENENHPCDAHINKVSGNNGVTDGDAPLFDDADVHDEVKEDEAKKKIDKQCADVMHTWRRLETAAGSQIRRAAS